MHRTVLLCTALYYTNVIMHSTGRRDGQPLSSKNVDVDLARKIQNMFYFFRF